MDRDKSELIARATNPLRWENVYVIGSFDRRITFYTQQVRALELIKALFDTDRLTSGKRVIVVGGGAAGVTAAVAAACKGCNVQLYEERDDILNLQASSHRYLHPHIYKWPERGSEDKHARLPLLDWEANSAQNVVNNLRAQFRAHLTSTYKENLTFKKNIKINDVTTIPAESNSVMLKVTDKNGSIENTADVLIIAIGFGLEKVEIKGYDTYSYWREDGLLGPFSTKKDILVSGAGDGGLIDLARATLQEFQQDSFIDEIKHYPEFERLANQMNTIDEELGNQNKTNLYTIYDERLSIDLEILEMLRAKKRSDTNVTFNFRHSAFDLQSALINRLVAFLLINDKIVQPIMGDIVLKSVSRKSNGKWHVPIAKENYEADLLVLRHGPNSNFFSRSFVSEQFVKSCIHDLSGKVSQLELTGKVGKSGKLDLETANWYRHTTDSNSSCISDSARNTNKMNLFETIDDIYIPLFKVDPNRVAHEHEKQLAYILSVVLEPLDNDTRSNYNDTPDHNVFIQILNNLSDETKTAQFIQFRGVQGTGKSSAVGSLDIILRKRYLTGHSSLIPIRIDAGKYIDKYSEKRNIKRKIIDLIKNDIHKIWEKVTIANGVSDMSKVILLLYGVGEQNFFSTKVITNALETFTQPHKSYISSIVVALHDKFNMLDHINQYGLDLAANTFRFMPIDRTSQNIDRSIGHFVGMYRLMMENESRNDDIEHITGLIIEKLTQFNLRRVDIHLLSLLSSKINQPHYQSTKNLAEFLAEYCKERLDADNEELIYEELIKSGRQAHRMLISALKCGESDNHSTSNDELLNENILALINEHKNLRDYLAAFYIVETLKNIAQPYIPRETLALSLILDDKILNEDFPESVNRFAKNIINSDDTCENLILIAVKKLLRDNKIGQSQYILSENFLLYILGRFHNIKYTEGAVKVLEEYKIKYKTRLDESDNNRGERILNKARLRTVFVSLAYLRAEGAVKEYLHELLTDNESASIDRGYHLIYYGDRFKGDNEDGFHYLDDESTEWTESFEVLKSAIRMHLRGVEKDEPMLIDELFPLRLVSLMSFAQSRHLKKRLSTNQKEEIISIIEDVIRLNGKRLNNDLDDTSEAIQFARSILIDLKIDVKPCNQTNIAADQITEEYYKWKFIIDLYKLKSVERQGWLDRGFRSYVGGRAETVLDHTCMVQLLALWLLPNGSCELNRQAPKSEDLFKKYDKGKIIEMLLVHDIAEAYTGDIIVKKLNSSQADEYYGKEKGAMEHIRFRDTLPGLYGGKVSYSRWLEFCSATSNKEDPSINAIIAKDLDRLDNLVQLWIYRKEINDEAVCREFEKNLIYSMNSTFISNLAKSFQETCIAYKDKLESDIDEFKFRQV